MLKFTAEAKERLDKFLATASQKSRGAVQKAIKAGVVTVNGTATTETDERLAPGDVVELPEFKEYEIVPTHMELKVVYEDKDMAVIDKPAGLVVHPGAGNTEDTLSHALLSRFPEIKSVGEKFRPGIVHRLDEDTSGLLLIARTNEAYDYLKRQFAERRIEKNYLALVHGIPEKMHDIIDVPLVKNFRQRKMTPGKGKEAVTEYTVVSDTGAGVDQMALLKVNLHTGRTHQIRVHLSHIKHPIVGDQLYGGTYKDRDAKSIDRQFLHAYRLRFQKMDETWIELKSALPSDLSEYLNKVNIKYDHII